MKLRLDRLDDRITPRAGDLDLTFGGDGRVDIPQLLSFADAELLADGRLVIVGFETRSGPNNIPKVVRLNPDGSLDTSFGNGGVVLLESNFQPRSLDIAPDGGIVMAGTAIDNRVVSLSADGLPDSDFGSNGTVNFAWVEGGFNLATSVDVRPDGSILVTGRSRSVQNPLADIAVQNLAVYAARLRPDGSFDPAYGVGGRVQVQPVVASSFSIPVAQPTSDGGIVALLTPTVPTPQPQPGFEVPIHAEDALLVRYTAEGVLDPTFGNGGTLFVDTLVSTDFIVRRSTLAVTDDGHIQVSVRFFNGGQLSGEHLFRYRADGSAETAFGENGVDRDFFSGLLASRPDSSLFVVTVVDPRIPDAARLFAYDAAGDPDTSFGADGVISGETLGLPPGTPFAPAAVLPTRDGGLVFIAQSLDSAPGPIFAVRLEGVDAPSPKLSGLPNATLVGFDDGGPTTLQFRSPTGDLFDSFAPFPGFSGGTRTATADFTGDGIADIVAGTGPGAASRVAVFDGVTQKQLFAVQPFEATFTGGVYVAAGDVDGDGVPDLAITPDEGGGPRVDLFSGGNAFAKIASFFGIDDANFRGGARASIADLTGDGTGDLVVVAGFGGGPRVAAFDGTTLATGPQKIFGDFFAFEETLRNGVFVTAGDLNGDGFADLIAGGGPGGGPRVLAFDGKSLLANQYVNLANFFAGDPANRGGVRLAVKDLDGDNRVDLIAGSGDGAGTRVTAYLGASIAATGTPPTAYELDAFPGFAGGVFVG